MLSETGPSVRIPGNCTFCCKLLMEMLLKMKWTLSWIGSGGCVTSLDSVAPSSVSMLLAFAMDGSFPRRGDEMSETMDNGTMGMEQWTMKQWEWNNGNGTMGMEQWKNETMSNGKMDIGYRTMDEKTTVIHIPYRKHSVCTLILKVLSHEATWHVSVTSRLVWHIYSYVIWLVAWIGDFRVSFHLCFKARPSVSFIHM